MPAVPVRDRYSRTPIVVVNQTHQKMVRFLGITSSLVSIVVVVVSLCLIPSQAWGVLVTAQQRTTTRTTKTAVATCLKASSSADDSCDSSVSSSSASSSDTTLSTMASLSSDDENSNNIAQQKHAIFFPKLCVFDLDACFWDQEMYTMHALPTQTIEGELNGRGRGVVGVRSTDPRDPIIRLHAGSLYALQQHYDQAYPGMKVAFASSADTPFAEECARAALKLLQVVPGVTVWDLVVNRDWNGHDINQIGRQPPLLSSNKARSHFPRLRHVTNHTIRYDDMLFFDDCLWGDHCGMVQTQCREADTGLGPVTVRTPNGLGRAEWQQGLELFHQRKLAQQ